MAVDMKDFALENREVDAENDFVESLPEKDCKLHDICPENETKIIEPKESTDTDRE